MPRLDNTPYIMQTLSRHENKLTELIKRVKELEGKLQGVSDIKSPDLATEPTKQKRRGRPPKVQI